MGQLGVEVFFLGLAIDQVCVHQKLHCGTPSEGIFFYGICLISLHSSVILGIWIRHQAKGTRIMPWGQVLAHGQVMGFFL